LFFCFFVFFSFPKMFLFKIFIFFLLKLLSCKKLTLLENISFFNDFEEKMCSISTSCSDFCLNIGYKERWGKSTKVCDGKLTSAIDWNVIEDLFSPLCNTAIESRIEPKSCYVYRVEKKEKKIPVLPMAECGEYEVQWHCIGDDSGCFCVNTFNNQSPCSLKICTHKDLEAYKKKVSGRGMMKAYQELDSRYFNCKKTCKVEVIEYDVFVKTTTLKEKIMIDTDEDIRVNND